MLDVDILLDSLFLFSINFIHKPMLLENKNKIIKSV